MNRISLVFISFIALVILRCGDRTTENSNVIAVENKRIESLNDSIFFARINDINIYKNNIFISDYKFNWILMLDNKFNIIQEIGKYGNGPKEFNGILQFEIMNDTIIAYQDNGRMFKLFSVSGKYISGFSSPVGSIIGKFAVDSSLNIYIPTPRREYPITVVDKNGNIINEFGEWFVPKKIWQKSERNYRYIELDKDGNVICVYKSEPIIEKYSSAGQLLGRINLKNNINLKDRVDFIEKKYSKEKRNDMVGSIWTLFTWIDIHDNYLYVSYIKQINKHNNILLIENSPGKIEIKKNIILKNNIKGIPYIKCFHVRKANSIIGFDNKIGQLINFEFSKK